MELFNVELKGTRVTGRGKAKARCPFAANYNILTTGGMNGAIQAAQRKAGNVTIYKVAAEQCGTVDALALR